jgi:YVTN family beta-propeller protein
MRYLLLLLAGLLAQAPTPAPQAPAASALDFNYFKTNVQPVFLAARGEHARCVSCHVPGQGLLRLQRMAPGATTWSDEESRKNFDAVSRLVLPGKPERSRLLLHPLATAAGGDGMHPGGKQWSSQSDPEWQAIAAWVRGPVTATAKTAARVIQTNSAGTTVSVIDPIKNVVVGTVKGIEVNHGVAAAPDGSRLYITNEAESSLDVADAKTFQVIKKIPLTGHPNNVSVGKDGKHVYAAIAVGPGAVDVIDTDTLTRVKSIPIQGAVHNTFVTPDGKYMIAGSVAGKTLTAVDTRTDEPAWVMTFEGGVRPITFETNADGSTKRMFVQISDFHGFAVVDFATHKEVSRITFPDVPGRKKNLEGVQGAPAHGIGITPDGKTLWATSKWYGTAYAYSMPDLTLLGRVDVGEGPEWLSFTADGKMYVGVAGEDRVSVVDTKAMKEVASIPVGYTPKRNITAVLQVN